MPTKETMTWQCRIAPSLGDGFAGHPNEVWGTRSYENDTDPTCFFGMYGLKDFQALWNHKGEKAILWAGSDIRNILKGYWLDKDGKEKLDPNYLGIWINENCANYVENSLEQIALDSIGIAAQVVPSFLGDVSKYPIQELRTDRQRYYTSVSGDDFELYGWTEIPVIAYENPGNEYHLYGNGKKPIMLDFYSQVKTRQAYMEVEFPPNVIFHGRVSQEQMDEETKTMTGALRLTRFDGLSEILAKSILWGQKPISPYIHYPFLNDREQFLSVVNRYPWNVKINQ